MKGAETMPIEVYIDGASAGDPGPSGLGIFIKDGQKTESFSLPAGLLSNHEAEFKALIEGMKLCAERNYRIVSFRTDSQIVERTADLEFVKNQAFKPYLDEIIRLKTILIYFLSSGFLRSLTRRLTSLRKRRYC